MDFFKKFFSSKSKSYDEIQDEKQEEAKMSDDERFVYHFVNNGGKFFYPDDMDDFKNQLFNLANQLEIDSFAVIERGYLHFLKKLGVPVKFSFQKNDVLLGGCESLIADEGAIMTTSAQTSEYRNTDLPKRRVIIALSNQITPNKSQALIDINKKYEKPPANIQTMSIFAPPANNLSGDRWYETYLFLIEN